MSESERARQIKEVIRRHLEEVGARRWKAVRIQCPEISDATFWRYVNAVRKETSKEVESDGTVQPIPSLAPNDEIPRLGEFPAFYTPLQKARLYESLLADAETMRTQAVDSRGRIINWRMFEKSIQLRERLVSQQVEVIDFFQNQEALKLFNDQLLKLAADLPTDVARNFVEQLTELQKRRLAVPQV
jgi:hypothetical protein